MLNFIKSLFCKHEYETITNLHGDVINYFGGYRSIKECNLCGKRKFGGLDKNCKEVNKIY